MLAFDIETAPQEGVLETRFAPAQLAYQPREFAPESVKRLKKESDDEYDSKVEEARLEHANREQEAQQAHEAKVAEKRDEFLDHCCLFAHLGRVLAIGVLKDDEFKLLDGDESLMLRTFWRQYQACVRRAEIMVGHNCHGFDIPFLVRRSWALDVIVPPDAVIFSGKFCSINPLIEDTAKYWLLGQYPRDTKWSLDAIGHCLGVGSKTIEGVEGKGWWRVFAADRDLAVAYLENDCRLTLAIYERLQTVASRLTR